MVHRNFCDNGKKPKPIRRRCNMQECSQPVWGTEEWGACSKSCGKLGIQIRVVQCIQHLHNGTNRTVHTKYCTGDKPDSRRPCSRIPCPTQWRTGAWSQCSVSCGEGIQQRQVVCKSSDNSIGQCEGDKPETVQVCEMAACPEKLPSVPENGDTNDQVTPKVQWVSQENSKIPVSKISSKDPCLGDKSIFCQMEVLARYCSIPGYNKLCCESCSKKVTTGRPPSSVSEIAVLPSPFPPLSLHPTAMSQLQRIKGRAAKERDRAAHGPCQGKTMSQSQGNPGNGTSQTGASRLLPLRQATANWDAGRIQSSPMFPWFPAALNKPSAALPKEGKSPRLSQDITGQRKHSVEPRQPATNLRTSSPVVT